MIKISPINKAASLLYSQGEDAFQKEVDKTLSSDVDSQASKINKARLLNY